MRWFGLKKRILSGRIYCHPQMNNMDVFNGKNNENKEGYLTGDFNIDLLKYETNLNIKTSTYTNGIK